jgi:hypothetical protein
MYVLELMDLLGFIPGDDWRKTDLVHARKEGEEGKYKRRPDELVLVEEGDDVERLWFGLATRPCSHQSFDSSDATCMRWRTLSFDFSFSCACVVTGAEACDCPATFLLRSSSACASAPVVCAVDAMVMRGGQLSGCPRRLLRCCQEGGRDSWLEAGFGGEWLVGTTELAQLRDAAVCNTTREKGIN